MRTFIDTVCESCGVEKIDVFVELRDAFPPCECGGKVVRLMKSGSSYAKVIGDECDVTVKHGICNADGTPRRYTSKTEMKREAEKRGLVNHVEHKPSSRSGDSSKHTSRWV